MIVGEDLESLRFTALADQPTRRLGGEPDQEDLENRRETLEGRRDTPCPSAVSDLESTESRPCSTSKLPLIRYGVWRKL